MSLERDVKTVSELKRGTSRLIDQVNQERRPLIITQEGKPRAVVMDVRSYEELRDSVAMLKLVAQGEEDLRKGRWSKGEDALARVEKRLNDALRHAPKKA